jgi:hypothetical protein
VDADEAPADDEIVGPALRSAQLAEPLRQHAHGLEVERHPVGAALRVALVLGVVLEGDGGGAAGDGLGLVRRRIGDRQAVAGDELPLASSPHQRVTCDVK